MLVDETAVIEFAHDSRVDQAFGFEAGDRRVALGYQALDIAQTIGGGERWPQPAAGNIRLKPCSMS